MNKFLSVILSGSALAGMAMTFVVAAAEPVEAKSACLSRYQACQSRCWRKYDDPFPCTQRTCNPQFDNCEGIGRGGRRGLTVNGKQSTGPYSPRPTDNRGPLESGGAKPKQNGGIVLGGMRPKTGIFADGPRSGFGRR